MCLAIRGACRIVVVGTRGGPRSPLLRSPGLSWKWTRGRSPVRHVGLLWSPIRDIRRLGLMGLLWRVTLSTVRGTIPSVLITTLIITAIVVHVVSVLVTSVGAAFLRLLGYDSDDGGRIASLSRRDPACLNLQLFDSLLPWG
ncbi:hypothetical protein HanRHA438_Chr01g0038181 [Helianthus annuus]|nr:hypothetical protein HanRHA438_Chr01g0038181 [Helianthus annuus]